MLVGFMGSGKSAIGRRVARQQDWDFVDLDDEVERREGRSIPDFFADLGEGAFREAEVRALRSLLSQAPADRGLVIALGGGTPTAPEAARLLQTPHPGRVVIYLDVDPDRAWGRVAGSGRPLARSRTQFRALAEGRRASYEAVAQTWVRSDGPPAVVAEQVLAAVHRHLAAGVDG